MSTTAFITRRSWRWIHGRMVGTYFSVQSLFFASSPRRRSRSFRLSYFHRCQIWFSAPNSAVQ